MTTTEAPPRRTSPDVEAALVRLKTVWRRHEWTPNLIGEYRRVLGRIDPANAERVMDLAIERTEINYPPAPGALAAIGREVASLRPRQTTSRRVDRSHDEEALIDALAFLAGARSDDDRELGEQQVRTIRLRLKDRGVAVEDRVPLRFETAAPDHRDPPGTIRYVVVQPDGQRVPRGARKAGER